ncbi:aldehyde dehydrogenase family protein [Caulobacter mirabilis]|uniref:aldehyde dehydrogenase (NAD(+)) n=1 Tax=Caulobacter mirabilis TaxID=69666 RepID=A0A2D2AZD6_9CAUL|nr:aldehyde dehydrogenase family protein [Caulobacter mirabilis]ATQ43354.1 aldehyde dehydrogenase [Caulobacter mirabilis]
MTAAASAWDAPLPEDLSRGWIHGETRAFSDRTLVSVDPSTGETLGVFDDGGAPAVEAAVASARAAFRGGWGRMKGEDRAARLLAWAQRIAEESEQLARLETLEVGRPITDAKTLIAQAPLLIGYYAGLIPGLEDRSDGAVRRPRGVVGAITPWNFPTANVILRSAPILAAGNTLVLKPSELSPRSAVLLARLATEAGLPAGVFNVIPGTGRSTGAALVAHPDVDMVAFTGSTETGKAIIRASVEQALKPLTMECGGKSPQLVLPDMIGEDQIWSGVFAAAFWNTGQWCAARTRLLLPRGGAAAAVEGLRQAAAGWTIGDPRDPATTLGPVASRRQYETVQAFREIAREAGEVIALPCAFGDLNPAGFYVRPELVLEPPQDGALVQQEVFGPLLTIQEYADLDEAIRLADGSTYGLGATIWSADREAAETVAAGLDVGSVSVVAAPGARPGLALGAPFEPRKQSGFGIEGGPLGLAAFTAPQAIAYVD